MSRHKRLSESSGGFAATKIMFLIFLLVVVILLLVGYTLFHDSDQSNIGLSATTGTASNSSSDTTNTSNASSNPYAVLSPATVPPKVAECSQQITYASNGDTGPVKCSNGGLNILEWNSLSALEPKVMGLGYSASASQVQTTLCSDVHANISNPIEETVYQISSLYYGWSFSSNPSSVITNGTCVNVDD